MSIFSGVRKLLFVQMRVQVIRVRLQVGKVWS